MINKQKFSSLFIISVLVVSVGFGAVSALPESSGFGGQGIDNNPYDVAAFMNLIEENRFYNLDIDTDRFYNLVETEKFFNLYDQEKFFNLYDVEKFFNLYEDQRFYNLFDEEKFFNLYSEDKFFNLFDSEQFYNLGFYNLYNDQAFMNLYESQLFFSLFDEAAFYNLFNEDLFYNLGFYNLFDEQSFFNLFQVQTFFNLATFIQAFGEDAVAQELFMNLVSSEAFWNVSFYNLIFFNVAFFNLIDAQSFFNLFGEDVFYNLLFMNLGFFNLSFWNLVFYNLPLTDDGFFNVRFFNLGFFNLLFFNLVFFNVGFFNVFENNLFFNLDLVEQVFFNVRFFNLPFFNVRFFNLPFFNVRFFNLPFFSLPFFNVIFFNLIFFNLIFFNLPFFSLPFFSLGHGHGRGHGKNLTWNLGRIIKAAKSFDNIDTEVSWNVARVTGGNYVGDQITAPVQVAILDTGIDGTHSELDGKVTWSVDLTENGGGDHNGHGTHVSGVIAADKNGAGIAGIYPNAELYSLKVIDSVTGEGEWEWLSEAIYMAVAGPDGIVGNEDDADVINMSFGSGDEVPPTYVHDAIKYAYELGVVLVAAGGNMGDGDASTNEINYPAAYPEVIGVSALDFSNTVTDFSSTGNYIELSAPGDGIISTYLDNSYAIWGGTSMATPHVSGIVALIIATMGHLPVGDADDYGMDTIRGILHMMASDLGPAGWDPAYGWGMVQYSASAPVTHHGHHSHHGRR